MALEWNSLPPEIHRLVIQHLVASVRDENDETRFQLAYISTVSRTFRDLLGPHIFQTVYINGDRCFETCDSDYKRTPIYSVNPERAYFDTFPKSWRRCIKNLDFRIDADATLFECECCPNRIYSVEGFWPSTRVMDCAKSVTKSIQDLSNLESVSLHIINYTVCRDLVDRDDFEVFKTFYDFLIELCQKARRGGSLRSGFKFSFSSKHYISKFLINMPSLPLPALTSLTTCPSNLPMHTLPFPNLTCLTLDSTYEAQSRHIFEHLLLIFHHLPSTLKSLSIIGQITFDRLDPEQHRDDDAIACHDEKQDSQNLLTSLEFLNIEQAFHVQLDVERFSPRLLSYFSRIPIERLRFEQSPKSVFRSNERETFDKLPMYLCEIIRNQKRIGRWEMLKWVELGESLAKDKSTIDVEEIKKELIEVGAELIC